jgi:D-alanyl-D-alanine carboxypeptidase/D-alanyl-D-alanine-endopeptidase (penicillin-binding protein 4)
MKVSTVTNYTIIRAGACITALLLQAWAGVLPDGSPQSAIAHLLQAKKYPGSTISVAIRNVERDSNLVDIGADSMTDPASVSKLLTASVAFEDLGLAYSFSTRVFADSIDRRRNSVAVQNLYIQGGADPGFTAERLWLFVEHLYHAGLRKISGNLVMDDSFLDSTDVGPGFDEEAGSESYLPLIDALSVNFNTIGIHRRPGSAAKDTVAIDLFPEMSGVRVESLATTTESGSEESLRVTTVADSGRTLVRVQGEVGLNTPGGYSFHKSWQTWEAFGNALIPLLARRGIAFHGKVIHAGVPAPLADHSPFSEFSSEPLSTAVNRMFKYSSNFTAEMLFKTLSATQRNDSGRGSWEKSSRLVAAWWRERGLPGTPVIRNGSGMGSVNRISPLQVTALLGYVWKQKSYLPDYLAALPAAGFDGTLKSRFTKSPLRGMVRAKTGTMNSTGISTLAGYFLPPRGGPYAFAIFCHASGHGQWEDWKIQEEILEKFAESIEAGIKE